jgi:hypothetical protein
VLNYPQQSVTALSGMVNRPMRVSSSRSARLPGSGRFVTHPEIIVVVKISATHTLSVWPVDQLHEKKLTRTMTDVQSIHDLRLKPETPALSGTALVKYGNDPRAEVSVLDFECTASGRIGCG